MSKRCQRGHTEGETCTEKKCCVFCCFARPELSLSVFDLVRLDRTNGGVLRYSTNPYNDGSFQCRLIII